MGHRLSQIVTRTGDAGVTGLGSGARVEKDSPPIEALGAIDELNSWVGVLISLSVLDQVRTALVQVQHDLFDLGAQVSVPGTTTLSPAHLARIDQAFERLNAGMGMLREFILPGGCQLAAFAHVARTVCRRAERRLLSLLELERASGAEVQHFGLAYLNRLSDLLFVIARVENKSAGLADAFWERGKSL